MSSFLPFLRLLNFIGIMSNRKTTGRLYVVLHQLRFWKFAIWQTDSWLCLQNVLQNSGAKSVEVNLNSENCALAAQRMSFEHFWKRELGSYILKEKQSGGFSNILFFSGWIFNFISCDWIFEVNWFREDFLKTLFLILITNQNNLAEFPSSTFY